MKIESLKKRSWKPVVCSKTGKWFTGWEGDAITTPRHWRPDEDTFTTLDTEHESRILTLKLDTLYRGRSAAGFVFTDCDGYEYNIGMRGIEILLNKILSGDLVPVDGCITAEFAQTKQGQNLFIEIAE